MKEMDFYTEETVIQALRNSLGNLDLASRELVVSRGQLYDYLVNHPEVMEAKRQIREGIKDEAEQLLVTKMKTDNNLLVFFLKTQAADRGYGSSTTISGPGGAPIQVNVNARTLIAAMRNGFTEQDQESEDSYAEEEEGIDEGRNLLEQSGIFSDGVGS